MDAKLPDSIRSRFAASLVANIVRGVTSFVTGLMLARWLGPEDYGRMAFLLVTLLAFKQLLDMASSSAFFTLLSQRQRSRRFITLYWCWIGIQFLFSLLVVGILLPDSMIESVWKGESRTLVVLALVAAFMRQSVWRNASQMAEAQRETIRLQRLNILVAMVHLAVVIALWLGGWLFLPLLFIALSVEWSVAGWLAARMYRGQENCSSDSEEEKETAASIFKEFWVYCKPFIPYVWVGFAQSFADRWMLQHWGGSREQAYFAVAEQFSAIALLATTSILRVFWKEIAEAKHQGNDEKVKSLYLKTSRGLYFVGALATGGLMPWAGEIITFLLGAAYTKGTLTLMLMLLYPVHQSMGQIGGTFLYATENVRILVVLGLAFMGASIVVTYFMLAPADVLIPGFGLKSQGLAIKMVVLQLILVNARAWYIARKFSWKFDWAYQVVGLGAALTAGWGVKTVIVSTVSTHSLVLMMISAVIYLIIMGGVVLAMPWLVGLDRDGLVNYIPVFLRKRYIPWKRSD